MARRPDTTQLRTVGLVLVPGTVAVYLAFRGGGVAAGLAALVAVACLAGLVMRAARGSLDAAVAARASRGAILALPGALTLYFAFNAGGFFPNTPAFVAIVLALILVVRVTTADEPLAGFSWPLAVAAGALGLYALWILLSGIWSDAPSRALIEFDRAFVYLLALVLFGSVPRTTDSLRWIVRGVALAIVVIATAAFLSRTAPDVFHTELGISPRRLGWPLTYWNALGILGAVGLILCFHLAASLDEPAVIRVIAAAAGPVLGATVLLTFSRGALGAGAIGLAVYAMTGRPRGLIPAALAIAPFTAIAVKAAYDATLLATTRPRIPAAIDQGHDLIVALIGCCAGAALVRLALVPADRRLRAFALPAELRRRVIYGGWAAAGVVAIVCLLAFDVPDRVRSQYDAFVNTTKIEHQAQTRQRLTDPANTGRIDHWNVAIDGYHTEPLRGRGAGTYGLYWMAHRPASNGLVVDDAHSLYVESLEETGLIGFLLVCTVLATILAAFVPLRRLGRTTVHGALLAAGVAWAIHAGADWDWEMPAVTAWLLCLGGAALAARAGTAGPSLSSGARVTLGVLVLAGAIAPALILVSERQLDDAVHAFNRGDCREARKRASASIRTLELRSEPYEVLGLCDVRQGFDRLGVRAMQLAVERDPDNWEFRYDLAVVRGSAGLDPRPAAQAALRLNPHDALTRALVRYANTSNPRLWIARMRPIAQDEQLSVVR